MGTVYRRKVRICRTCDTRLDTTAARRACEAAGHVLVMAEQPIWWVRYQAAGRWHWESAHSNDRAVADALLRAREAQPDEAPPPAPRVRSTPPAGVGFAEAAAALLADYEMNGRRSVRTLRLRITKHLQPFFGHYGLAEVRPPVVRDFIRRRQASGASNATINRDLITLKRMLALAVQDGRLPTKPYIPLLKEHNVRQGFFEPEHVQQVAEHLPPEMRGIALFAWITGWRTPSEILPLEWRQVDFRAGEVRLDAGTTKNGEGRVFPFTVALRQVLEAQREIAAALGARGVPARHVFCYRHGRKAGRRISESAYLHRWWAARAAARCPTRIPHDFRRTAVRNLVRAGVPERVAMQLTGHKTRAVFERYNIVSPGDLREAARRLDTYIARASA
jgi:integrase